MNRKYLFLAFGAIIIIIAFFFFGRGEKTVPPKNNVVVAFGDSLVQGIGSSQGNDFVSIVGGRINRSIINEGRSGDTTASALERIDTVLAHDPGVVIVLLGGNDYLRRIPKETTFENLGKIVTRLKENDTRVLLLGVRGGLLRDTYESDFKNLAKKEGLFYVPNVLDGLVGNREYMSDQIHPNDAGYKIIADRVAPELQRIIK